MKNKAAFFLIVGVATVLAGCARDSKPPQTTGTSTGISGDKTSKLSPDEVAAYLDNPGEESVVDFAKGLEVHSRTAPVIRILRKKFKDWNTVADLQKPLYLSLAAESLPVADAIVFAEVLQRTLATDNLRLQITALAIVKRHPRFAMSVPLRLRLYELLVPAPAASPLLRHWLTAAVQSIALSTPESSDDLLLAALVNPDLELATLLAGANPGRITALLELNKPKFKLERAALIRKALQTGTI